MINRHTPSGAAAAAPATTLAIGQQVVAPGERAVWDAISAVKLARLGADDSFVIMHPDDHDPVTISTTTATRRA